MTTRQLTIKTPLGEDELELVSLQGSEELSKLFSYNLELFSKNVSIDTTKILGENVTIKLETGDKDSRYFNGYVCDFTQVGRAHSTYAVYHASVRPWFWFLSRSADCRMFQDKNVPDIVKEVFSDNGFSDFDMKLNDDYLPWEYCVQYRETDFQFISRLLEQEGIYYFFKHEDGKHTLVLADSVSSHEKLCESALPYNDNENVKEDHLSDWKIHNAIQPGSVTLNDYDFKAPKKQLVSSAKVPRQHAEGDREFFDFPGAYVQKGSDSRGDAEARNRIDAFQVKYEQLEGQTNCRAFCAGGTFSMTDHPRKDQNREYLLLTAKYMLSSEQFTSGQGGEGEHYSCSLTAIPSATPFRPAADTVKPIVQGPQAAFVVDDQPDEFGRVKVQFYWDREGQASCWVRVSQNSAGSGWGSMFVPHIGHEVLVSFYEGDPDRPIITGKVYNADNMPPDLWEGGTSNSVITDHVENKINLDGAGTPIMHFTQPSGNEILMNDEEGIQIRDKFGNEIITDAVAGTMKFRSPSHESVIELGKSILSSTDSDAKTIIGGNSDTIVSGKMEMKILDFTTETFVGMKQSNQLAVTNDTFVGLKMAISKAYDISKNYDKKHYEDTVVKRDAKVSVLETSPKIDYQAGKSTVSLREKTALINSGKSLVEIDFNDAIKIESETQVYIKGPDQVCIEAKKGGVKIDGGSKSIKVKGKDITVKGSKINIG